MMYVIIRLNLVRFIVGRVENVSEQILDNLNRNLLSETVNLIEIYRILVLDKKSFFVKHFSRNMLNFLFTVMEKLIYLNDIEMMYLVCDFSCQIFYEIYKIFIKFLQRTKENYGKKCLNMSFIVNQELFSFTKTLLFKVINYIDCDMKTSTMFDLLEEIYDINLELIETGIILNQYNNFNEYLAFSMEDSIHLLEKLCKTGNLFSHEKTTCKLIEFIYNYLIIHNNNTLNTQEY